MKKLFLLIFLISGAAWSDNIPSHQSNSFGMMPHKKILEININKCEAESNAMGDEEAGKICIENQQTGLNKLKIIYNDHAIAAPSWSLCIAESKIPDSYNYVTMYACMKVVKDICKETPDGQWENPNLCINSIESGSWWNNPKVYQPYKKQ